MEQATCTIDDAGPFPLIRPADAAEVCETVRRAAADEKGVFPVGGCTMLGFGLPPNRHGVAVDLRGLSRVIDYPARDMTVTVQAGITVAELQRLLGGENQRLPIDVPHPDRATLGGAIATNVSGPRRYGFGTLRDYVIGISTVNDEGHEVKAGGRVVKNVAGYDLCKLHVGALGSLGIVTQVTLKLRPLPEESALLTFRCGPESLGPVLDRLHATRTRPVCIDVHNARAAAVLRAGTPEGGWVVVVGFEESGPAVRWQIQQLVKELSAGGINGAEALVNAAAVPLWYALRDFPLLPGAVLTFKANLLPHAVADFCHKADALPEAPLLRVHAGNGIVTGHIASDLTPERAAAMLKELQTTASEVQGNVIVLCCPAAWKATLPVWGAPRSDAALMRAVKDKLDPRRLFNPGRFLTG